MRGDERDASSAEGVITRVATQEHLPEVLGLADAWDEAPQWPANAWRAFVEPPVSKDRESVLFLAHAVGGELCGWLAASRLLEQTELESLLVSPRYRRQGAGRRLVAHWQAWAAERGVREALLEVRVSNEGARQLYRELGFREQGRRRNYYQHPAEDAVLMQLALPARARATAL